MEGLVVKVEYMDKVMVNKFTEHNFHQIRVGTNDCMPPKMGNYSKYIFLLDGDIVK